MEAKAQDIVDFWQQAGPAKWFVKDGEFDRAIHDRFLPAHEAAARGELAHWEDSPASALALLLLLDQFPRNLYRDSAHAFATDPLALNICKRALNRGFDAHCDENLKQFFYMPLMHSEDIADQILCLALCLQSGQADNVKYGVIHRDIIARFGRFPHRNKVFGRVSTADEQTFLDGGGFAG